MTIKEAYNLISTGTYGFDPVLLNMVRKVMPNILAYDICDVQVFSLKPSMTIKEAFENIQGF